MALLRCTILGGVDHFTLMNLWRQLILKCENSNKCHYGVLRYGVAYYAQYKLVLVFETGDEI